jgi:hypothetical protein
MTFAFEEALSTIRLSRRFLVFYFLVFGFLIKSGKQEGIQGSNQKLETRNQKLICIGRS